MHQSTCMQPSAELPVLHTLRAEQTGDPLPPPCQLLGSTPKKTMCQHLPVGEGLDAELHNLVILIFVCTWLL